MVVEGQPDAITMAQWGLDSVALCGTGLDDGLQADLQEVKYLFLGLDDDKAGLDATLNLAMQVNPMARVVRWPQKDANDWLQVGGGRDDVRKLMNASPTAAEWLTEFTIARTGVARQEMEVKLWSLLARLKPLDFVRFQPCQQ